MNDQIITMLERMAETGTAPEDGCLLFGVGYEEAFERLRGTYLLRRFQRGGSAEKFVVGPFGSGKTHFLRQLMELAREDDCVTSEIILSKSVDFTKSLTVYRELCRELRTPHGVRRGIENLLEGIAEKISSKAVDSEQSKPLLRHWTEQLGHRDFELPAFARMVQRAFYALVDDEIQVFQAASRWLSGEGDDRALAKELGVSPITRSEENLLARRCMLSLFQLIRAAGFTGTVVCLDEAEQGLSADKRKTERILSMLQSDINSIADLSGGSALIVYGLTADLFRKMEDFPALQQRVADPTPGHGFFDGDVYAPKIDITRRDSSQDLPRIGRKLVELCYEACGSELRVPIDEALNAVDTVAAAVIERDVSSGNRRTMVKRTCSLLLRAYDQGELIVGGVDPSPESLDEEI